MKNNNSTLIIAHRGAKSLAKIENTIEAFAIAIELKVKMVEFDVRRTKDKQLIVFHDPCLENKSLETLTYQEICSITKKEGFTPPLLLDVLKLCKGKIMLDIELKEDGYVKEVLELLCHFFHPKEFIITSFLDKVIRQTKQINPDIKAGLLIGKDKANLWQRITEVFPFRRIKSSKADFVVPNYRLVTPWLVYYSHIFQYRIYVWTVNADKTYHRLIKHKVAGIITDYPQRYIKHEIIHEGLSL